MRAQGSGAGARTGAGMPGWRFLDTGSARGPVNMAVDEALMESVRHGAAPALRVYRWSRPCLSLGRNQPARGWYDPRRLAEFQVDVVRRPTGGRAVLHDEELTYSVVCSDRELGSPRSTYRRINEVLLAGLAALGAGVGMQEPTTLPAARPSTVPCFDDPAEGEILARGRKLVGSAQVRVGGVLLQHGSLPLRPGRTAARDGTLGPETIGAPAYLETVLGVPIAWERLVEAIRASWTERIDTLSDSSLTSRERDRTSALVRRYEDPAWTWRR